MAIRRFCLSLCCFLVACSEGSLDPVYKSSDCRKTILIDSESGQHVRGAEDIIAYRDGDTLLVSAYDRWASEQAARSSLDQIPRGGLYRIDLPVTDETVTVTNLAAPFLDRLDFRPHGIDLWVDSDGTVTVAAINRRYERKASDASQWHLRPTLELFSIAQEGVVHLETIESDLLCRANDVAFDDKNHILVTGDRQACGGFDAAVETVFDASKGQLLTIEREGNVWHTKINFGNLTFPNGLVVERETDSVYVAQTRSKKFPIARVKLGPNFETVELFTTFEMGGAPDNLNMAADGNMIVAVHPSLLRLGAYRYRWMGRKSAPSRLVQWSPADLSTRLLYDDRDGKLFSAATVGVRAKGQLIAGSVADEGLLVCDPPGDQ